MDRYLNHLNQDLPDGLAEEIRKATRRAGKPMGVNRLLTDLIAAGDYAVKHNETMKVAETCNHCGGPVIGPYVKTSYGMFHSHCHGAAQRSLRHRFMKES